jgi:hypothetical protein
MMMRTGYLIPNCGADVQPATTSKTREIERGASGRRDGFSSTSVASVN